jgi:hypothetical protein
MMGRGLSELQWCILKLAEEKKPATYQDILVDYFGWKILPVGRGVRMKKCPWAVRADGYKNVRDWFDEEAIGRKPYVAALASISRACSRLKQRGLIGWGRHYPQKAGKFQRTIYPTEQGHEFLTVKTPG